MRKLILSAIGLVIILLAVLGAYLIIENSNKPKPRIEKVVKTVFAETVTNTTVPITIPANGTLVAKHKLELYSEVQGVFQSSAHDFKAGQPYRRRILN